jgi:hypothetical protein
VTQSLFERSGLLRSTGSEALGQLGQDEPASGMALEPLGGVALNPPGAAQVDCRRSPVCLEEARSMYRGTFLIRWQPSSRALQ